ncbi:elongator complex protein 3 [Adlercreutzia sp. ZJ141]|uniref:elongator complex protein 3 n=1 Tax=Adlercreutzia sp. ZJ141 TaxID=2709406 RepID=UPI0013EC0A0C|nr:GNAT family N-acetyltransferase [Adlercreutzia sp. ZJ141]
MESLLLDILARLNAGEQLDAKRLEALVRSHSGQADAEHTRYSKKMILPFYLNVKANDPARWQRWQISTETERQLFELLRMKPRRTASGVATITVITKPWKCGSNCLYCPNDLRMPKSYLSEEPACQRAERVCFDPYLQVVSRLQALMHMGHVTDKVELIVLGGTWSDYPHAYQIWFATELFRALNDCGAHEATQPDDIARFCIAEVAQQHAEMRRAFYRACGVPTEKDDARAFVAEAQAQVNVGKLTYNQAAEQLYEHGEAWRNVARMQVSTLDDLKMQQRKNEAARHRAVGFVIETRPDTITPDSLFLIRQLGCTKIQMGIQSLDARILKANRRGIGPERIARAFELARLYGFKLHAHFMVNLLGATPDADKRDYLKLVSDTAYLPDEVKLYPCALVAGTGLCEHYKRGTWRPYSEDELVDVLAADMLATPAYLRISRMIRDISAGDIVAGNKKTNLRQLVEQHIEQQAEENATRPLSASTAQEEALSGTTQEETPADAAHKEAFADTTRKEAPSVRAPLHEIRYRELGSSVAGASDLTLDVIAYDTSVTSERFLQWVTPENRIAGFLRLSLPNQRVVRERATDLAIGEREAMIREVHVYGKVAGIGGPGQNAQHLGLGRTLIERACAIAREHGYTTINVISAVGTREYYRHLGFHDNENGLYQQRLLVEPDSAH